MVFYVLRRNIFEQDNFSKKKQRFNFLFLRGQIGQDPFGHRSFNRRENCLT